MRIERSHLPWALFSLVLVTGGAYVYHRYTQVAINGPSGSSAVGLTFGIMAAICMAFTGLLGLRRRYRSWRVGSARFWLRGHLWMGLVTLPLVWFHAGFRNGGMLTLVIMVLLYAVWISGIFGIVLQQFLPRFLKTKVPNETLASQISTAIDGLRNEAAKIAETSLAITDVYTAAVLPFLSATPTSGGLVMVAGACKEKRATLDSSSSAAVDRIERICNEYQSLINERRLLWWMHSWLLIHVPLSMALLLLTAIHIIMALRLAI